LKFEVKPYGIDSVFLEFGNNINFLTHKKVKGLYHSLRKYSKSGIKAVIPSYCALTILFEPSLISLVDVVNLSSELLDNINNDEDAFYLVRIPVCYDHKYAIDWEEVCEYTGKKWEEIISLHTKKRYLVYMLGFVPGFLYLGSLPTELEIPRKKVPRLKVEMGSVGLADNQTGIYPMEIPGGWQIIGRTPLDLINNSDMAIEMGDYIEFYQISKKEFNENSFKIKRLLLNDN
tara:strand:- start:39 stop:734 length:696 start_codon:yes stop_codon:yes gene_type:complete